MFMLWLHDICVIPSSIFCSEESYTAIITGRNHGLSLKRKFEGAVFLSAAVQQRRAVFLSAAEE